MGINNDSRCAASDFTIPTQRTAAAITKKTEGSNKPKVANTGQLDSYLLKSPMSGFKKYAVNPVATT